ncbi:MAG TPA: porin [Chitinophagaceae bacterium]|nr:porin [Chitinophagaceae bacterium]
MKITIFTMLVVSGITVSAQDSSVSEKKSGWEISGYADIYYQYDFNKPPDKLRPPFLYNFKKHNEINTNLILLKASYDGKKIRANLGVMAGNYSRYNLAAEPEFFRYIYEASIGYKFSEKVSLDAGILPSHIGCESAIAKDNWNLSRSILAESSPYYETGIKFNYTPNDQWTFSLLGLQGWQNIKDYNSSKAFGTQIIFVPNEKMIVGSSSFIGNEKPDSAKQVRLFHNFHFTYHVSSKLKTLFMLDFGAERNADKEGYNKWMGTALLLQYSFTTKFVAAARAEFYRDKYGVIISNYLPGQFETTGLAFNLDFHPTKNFVIRAEMRSLHSKTTIFTRNSTPVQSNFSLLTSTAFYF